VLCNNAEAWALGLIIVLFDRWFAGDACDSKCLTNSREQMKTLVIQTPFRRDAFNGECVVFRLADRLKVVTVHLLR